jgi:hypothetical protein
VGTSDQRPAAAVASRGARVSRENRRPSDARLWFDETRDRMAPKPSDMISPRATPSHSARSMSSGRRLVAVPSSPAKHAPRSRSTSITSAVPPTTGSPGSPPARAAMSNHGRSTRATNEIGVAFDGATAGASTARVGGLVRNHATSPS